MAEDDLTINVWVGNLGRYNEGTLIGGWRACPWTSSGSTGSSPNR